MASDKLKVTTPKGLARFITLGRETTFNGQGTGKQEASIILDGEGLAELTKIVEDFKAETFTPKQIKAGINGPFKEKDGKVFITAKAYATRKTGEKVVIPVVDARSNPIKNPPDIGNGSTIRLRIALKPTEFQGKNYIGVDLIAVKLIKLVEYSSTGFTPDDDSDDEEGAYYANEFSGSDEGASGGSGDDLDDEVPF